MKVYVVVARIYSLMMDKLESSYVIAVYNNEEQALFHAKLAELEADTMISRYQQSLKPGKSEYDPRLTVNLYDYEHHQVEYIVETAPSVRHVDEFLDGGGE